jgi:hypothetical protein
MLVDDGGVVSLEFLFSSCHDYFEFVNREVSVPLYEEIQGVRVYESVHKGWVVRVDCYVVRQVNDISFKFDYHVRPVFYDEVMV